MAQTHSVADAWRKSARCETHNCVEVAERADAVAIRNSSVPDAQLAFAHPAWAAFISGVRAGQFDLQ
ncbi:DUF397 domain-containing protein [Phytohabitans sp. ZYX-F-186]|uniref:DUF397 domain-containing protein n=1 Tax=Phytohabitans maris TaxID=3071409 RepID=A0ABU0ZN72_9ACTN|nr:DUF397 domain-containing protein [Phytohabitans sp. ZYX-F-186]MDQ7907824.1 DUF397 domain-containing protein [Phytohabitans sp. ZYX-F-186]